MRYIGVFCFIEFTVISKTIADVFDPTAVLENESRLPLYSVEKLQMIMVMMTVGAVEMTAMKQWQHPHQDDRS